MLSKEERETLLKMQIESPMQSRWKELEAIHTSLEQKKVNSVDPDTWHQIIKETFTASSAGDSVLCHVSPASCLHCHQLAALSAVTTLSLTLTVKECGDGSLEPVEEIYLHPLLKPNILKALMVLFLHQCEFLRYQVRRTMAALVRLNRISEAAVHDIIEMCINTVLQHSSDSALCVEPLQLLCTLLSRRSGLSHHLNTSRTLLSHLPALYSHCCGFSFSRTNTSTNTCSDLVKSSYGSRDKPHETNLITVFDKNQEEGSEEPTSAKRSRADILRTEVLAHQHHPEAFQHLDVKSRQDISGYTKTKSVQAENLHFVFLCLVQKLSKQISSLDEPERNSQLQSLNETVLNQLIRDHLPFLSSHTDVLRNRGTSLIERKFLDVLDTTLNYMSFRTQKVPSTLLESIAAQFVHAFEASNCAWLFPFQHTFIGGDIARQEGCHGNDSDVKEGDKAGGVCGDEGCRPVLVLLLAVVLKSCAILFKTATGKTGDIIRTCAALLHSMHNGLNSQLCMTLHADVVPVKNTSSPSTPATTPVGNTAPDDTFVCCTPVDDTSEADTLLRNSSVESTPAHSTFGDKGSAGGTPELALHLDWLPQVCQEQDDHWLEALLCMLDIVIQAQSLCIETSEVQSLITLMDPHLLFIQLLYLTHYDLSLLIDWLTSPETCFLAYLVRYLRLMAHDFSAFCLSAGEWNFPQSVWSCPDDDEEADSLVKVVSDSSQQELKNEIKKAPMGLCSFNLLEQSSIGADCSLAKPQVNPHEFGDSDTAENNPFAKPLARLPVPEDRVGVGETSCLNRHSLDSSGPSKPAGSIGLVLLSGYGDDDGNSNSDSDDGDEACDGDNTDSSDDNGNNTDESDDENTDFDDSGSTFDAGNTSDYNTYENYDQYTEDWNDEEILMGKSFKPSFHNNKPRISKHARFMPNQIMQAKKLKPNSDREETGDGSPAECINRVMSLLTSLRLRLQKLYRGGLLPYNPKLLISLIEMCEKQYCNMQL